MGCAGAALVQCRAVLCGVLYWANPALVHPSPMSQTTRPADRSAATAPAGGLAHTRAGRRSNAVPVAATRETGGRSNTMGLEYR